MLKDSLYTIQSLEESGAGSYEVMLRLNPAHTLFEGHFPGQPVLPGVCLLEMVKELLTEIRQKPMRLVNAGTIKFPNMVDPRIEPLLRFEITIAEAGEELKVGVNSFLSSGSANFKLIKASFV